jgi:isoprenylcysteine carboxyl methyltransferase (ICMT) family protein YpbQ
MLDENYIVIFFCIASVVRLISVVISIKNETNLKNKNAIEYGKLNSKALVICHTLFYVSCICEGLAQKVQANEVSLIGFGLFILSMIMLLIVIVILGNNWTLKLMIAPGQHLNSSFLFKYIRHPNYVLAIIPELISIALICHAWLTLFIGLPLYLIPLTIRIIQEEKVMKKHFGSY